MSTFELQTFHAGKWAVDSYFDDRELAMSEAERLDTSGRHPGVRVLQEDFSADSNKSTVRVVFSKMKGSEDTGGDWRGKVQQPSQKTVPGRASSEGVPKNRRRQAKPKSKSNLYLIISIAIVLLLAGVAAMVGLQEFAKFI